MSSFTVQELKSIIAELKAAYKEAVASGGVISYSVDSGQGKTGVSQASLAALSAEIDKYTKLLNELLEIESGSNCTFIRDLGY